MQGFRMNPEFGRYLELHAKRSGRSPREMRVLDFGCGRGEYAAWLRARGYEAFGVDLDAAVLERGRPCFRELGLDAERVLVALGPDGAIPFPDGFFDFVCSEQVLEHVRDLEATARELARVSARGAGGLHCFPARWRPVEVHLRLPFVHWLPAGGPRRLWIAGCVRLGLGARWPRLEGLDSSARAREYYRYSVERTCYRRTATIRAIFERAGFRVRFVTIENVEIERRPALARLLRIPPLRALASWLLLRFKLVELATERSGPGGAPLSSPGARPARASALGQGSRV
jgi:SAM-dependent methyltransferase